MLDAAGRLFATHGYAATSMDQIAAAAGITKPMLYNYFGSKQGLYLAYVRQASERLFHRLFGAAAAEISAERRLVLGLDAFLEFVDERRHGWALLFHQTSVQHGPLAGEIRARRQRLAEVATVMLGEVARERGGNLPPRTLNALGHALIGAAESLANWWLDNPEVPRQEVLDALLALTTLELAGRSARRPPDQPPRKRDAPAR